MNLLKTANSSKSAKTSLSVDQRSVHGRVFVICIVMYLLRKNTFSFSKSVLKLFEVIGLCGNTGEKTPTNSLHRFLQSPSYGT